jgi:hypothetical protein
MIFALDHIFAMLHEATHFFGPFKYKSAHFPSSGHSRCDKCSKSLPLLCCRVVTDTGICNTTPSAPEKLKIHESSVMNNSSLLLYSSGKCKTKDLESGDEHTGSSWRKLKNSLRKCDLNKN